MKKFYAWYQKHITGAIFIGLLLGILTGLFLADRFAPVLTVTSLLGVRLPVLPWYFSFVQLHSPALPV